MSERSLGAKPDLMVPVIVLMILLVVVYVYIAPFRLFVKGLFCIWYAIMSFIVLDFKAGKLFLDLSAIMLNNYKYKHVVMDPKGLKFLEETFSLVIEQVRFRFFVLFATIFAVVSFLFRKLLSNVPSYYGKFNLKDLLQKKYGLQIKFNEKGKIAEPFEKVYAKVANLKRRRNFPINLIARFFPPDGKERVFLYTGSYSYRFVPIKVEKTLKDYLIEIAEKERKREFNPEEN